MANRKHIYLLAVKRKGKASIYTVHTKIERAIDTLVVGYDILFDASLLKETDKTPSIIYKDIEKEHRVIIRKLKYA